MPIVSGKKGVHSITITKQIDKQKAQEKRRKRTTGSPPRRGRLFRGNRNHLQEKKDATQGKGVALRCGGGSRCFRENRRSIGQRGGSARGSRSCSCSSSGSGNHRRRPAEIWSGRENSCEILGRKRIFHPPWRKGSYLIYIRGYP